MNFIRNVNSINELTFLIFQNFSEPYNGFIML